MTPLPAGSEAPDFELRSSIGENVSLGELRGRPVVLGFYPNDWSPVCTDQLGLYQMLLPEFQRFDAALVGISVDSRWSHLAFARDRNPAGLIAWSYVSPVGVNPGADGVLNALESLEREPTA